MSADTPDVEPTGWDRMCSDCRVIARDYVVAARVAAGRERANAAALLALAAEIEDGRVQRPGMQRRRRWAERIRAALGGGAS